MINSAEKPLSIKEALIWGNSLLSVARGENSRLDAEAIMAFCIIKDKSFLFAHLDDLLTEQQLTKFKYYIGLRAQNYPIQYITGKQEFMSLEFKVSPAVLIPRFDTEVLVEKALELASSFPDELRIADIGTGSGAIAISLAKYLPHAKVMAVDVSKESLFVAQENALSLGVNERIEFKLGNLLEPLLGESFHLIISNPPYISEAEFENLEGQVKDWEPKLALYGGFDGLDYYRKLTRDSKGYLVSGGYLMFEIGYQQGKDIKSLMEKHQYTQIELIQDWGNRDRVIYGKNGS